MRDRRYLIRIVSRWMLVTASLGVILFFAAGTTEIDSLRAYMVTFSGLLLVAMVAVEPNLAKERSTTRASALGAGSRFSAGLLSLLTLAAGALDVGRIHRWDTVPPGLRLSALALFAGCMALQISAMILNPFFSPVVRIQNERGHHVVVRGPYRFLRHPGYLAMLVAVPSSALAIGSWFALLPALVFSGVIILRTAREDGFLVKQLPGYSQYTSAVSTACFAESGRHKSNGGHVYGGMKRISRASTKCLSPPKESNARSSSYRIRR